MRFNSQHLIIFGVSHLIKQYTQYLIYKIVVPIEPWMTYFGQDLKLTKERLKMDRKSESAIAEKTTRFHNE